MRLWRSSEVTFPVIARSNDIRLIFHVNISTIGVIAFQLIGHSTWFIEIKFLRSWRSTEVTFPVIARSNDLRLIFHVNISTTGVITFQLIGHSTLFEEL